MQPLSTTYRIFLFLLFWGMVDYAIQAQSPGQFIVAYEFWIDDDFNSRNTVEVAPVVDFELNDNLDVGELSDGIHNISFRFRDDSGIWSGILKRRFVHFDVPVQPNTIVKAEYWFDNDYSTVTEIPILSSGTIELNTDIDCSGLSAGFHVLSMRFQDSSGEFNPSMNQSFYLKPSNSGNELVIGYRYWFNDNFDDLVFVSANPPADPYELLAELETNGVGVGPDQKFCIQFLNSALLWTSAYCGYFNRDIGCLADLNGDTEVNSADLNALLVVYGCVSNCTVADFNADGTVNSADLNFLLSLYGSNCLTQE